MEQNETRVFYPVHISCTFYDVQVKCERKQFVSYVNQFTNHILFSIRLYAVYTPVWRYFCFCSHHKRISMRTNVHLWHYLAEFCVEWEIFQTNVVKQIKTQIICLITFLRKSCRLWDNVENIVEPDRSQMTIQYGAERCV